MLHPDTMSSSTSTEPVVLRGTIEKIMFHASDTGFAVVVLRQATTSCVVRGTFSTLHVGQDIQVTGEWTTHPKFGHQFAAEHVLLSIPTHTEGIKRYLASGIIKGVGEELAQRLIDHFGSDVLRVIEETPDRLAAVPGIGDKRVQAISEAWQHHRAVASIMVFLSEKQISPAYAAKLYKQYGLKTIAVLQENPYRIVDEVWGIGFSIADRIAQQMGIPRTSSHRICAGIMCALQEGANQGHCYIELETLRARSAELLGCTPEEYPLIKRAFHTLYEQHNIVLHSLDNLHYVALARNAHAERACAQRIATLTQHTSPLTLTPERIFHYLHTRHDLSLHELQQHGIINALTKKVTVITGGPGTGKTTLVQGLIKVCEQEQIKYTLAAPTGRAAKRLSESTRRNASTIHRLLEFDPSTMRFKHNEDHALTTQILIVDEVSMVDIHLMLAVLKALPLTAHLVLIGDHDQLPSVGIGNVLGDLITSECIPVIRLTEIFRQAADSMIITNAHRINRGEFPTMSGEGKRDFIFIKEDDPTQVATHIEKLLTHTLERNGIPSHILQVLTPMNKGPAGTVALNTAMQQLINPHPPKTVRAGSDQTIGIGDRVMQLRNNYDKNVFNGDSGIIHALDTEEQIATIMFGDRSVAYSFDELNELTLSYAITVHKSQGSEYDAVAIPLFTQHYTLLQKNLLYTALTRAKKLCVIIGQPRAIGIALSHATPTKRVTFLAHYLRECLAS